MTQYFKHRMRTKKYGIIASRFILGIFAAIGFALLIGLIIMLLWNWLMPAIFGLVTINYWQAVGIIILAKFLFGGFGNRRSKRRYSKFRNRFNEKFHANYEGNSKSDFSKWRFYDNYWEDEGENAYKEYVERRQKINNDEKQ